MAFRDYLALGLKLLGVYFAVMGFTVFATSSATILIELAANEGRYDRSAADERYFWITLMQPVSYLICSVALIRQTDWCLDLVDPHRMPTDDSNSLES